MMRKHTKRLVWVSYLLIFAPLGTLQTGCGTSGVNVTYECPAAESSKNAVTGDEKGPGYGVLKAFSDEVNRLPIHDDSASMNDIQQKLLQKSKELLFSNKKILHQHALWGLNRLPVGARMDTSGWVSAVEKEVDIQDLYNMYASQNMAVEDVDVILHFFSWDGVKLFYFLRQTVYAINYSAATLGRMYTIESASVPLIVRLNDDLENPVLAVQKEHDFFAISFSFDATRQLYTPVRIEWLVPKLSRRPLKDGVIEGDESNAVEIETPYLLSLQHDETFMARQPMIANEKRYSKWKKTNQIRVGQSHLFVADTSLDEQYLLVMSAIENTVRIYDASNRALLGNYQVDGLTPSDEYLAAHNRPGRGEDFPMVAQASFDRGTAAFWPVSYSSGDGPLFVVGTERGLALYSALDGHLVQRISDIPVWQMRYSKDNQYLLCVNSDIDTQTSTLSVFHVAEQPELVRTIESDERIEDMALSANNQLLGLTFYPSDTVTVIDLSTGERRWTEPAPQYTNSIDFSPDGRLLALGGDKLVLLSTENPSLKATYANYNNNIDMVRFSPSGDAVASSSYDGRVRIVNTDISSGQLRLLKALRHGGTANVYSVTFIQNGESLISSSGDKSVIIWGK